MCGEGSRPCASGLGLMTPETRVITGPHPSPSLECVEGGRDESRTSGVGASEGGGTADGHAELHPSSETGVAAGGSSDANGSYLRAEARQRDVYGSGTPEEGSFGIEDVWSMRGEVTLRPHAPTTAPTKARGRRRRRVPLRQMHSEKLTHRKPLWAAMITQTLGRRDPRAQSKAARQAVAD